MTYPVKSKEDGGGPEPVQTSSPFLNLIPCEWNPEFAARRELDYSIENKPYIESRAELGVEDNVETLAEPDNVETRAEPDDVETRAEPDNVETLAEPDNVETRAEPNNVETRAESGEEESVVRAFMRGSDEPGVCLPQADKVEAFASARTWNPSEQRKRKPTNPSLLGWMKEVSREGRDVQEHTENP